MWTVQLEEAKPLRLELDGQSDSETLGDGVAQTGGGRRGGQLRMITGKLLLRFCDGLTF